MNLKWILSVNITPKIIIFLGETKGEKVISLD